MASQLIERNGHERHRETQKANTGGVFTGFWLSFVWCFVWLFSQPCFHFEWMTNSSQDFGSFARATQIE